jgi:tetratricopeptide (TPR) repeat protein
MPRTLFCCVVSFVGLAIYPTSDAFAQRCQPYWTAAYKCAMNCGPCGGGTAPGTNTAPSAPAPPPGEAEARDLNQKGVDAYNSGNYDSARNLFQEALDKWPNNSTIAENLQKAKDQIAHQADLKKQKQDEEFNRNKQEALGQLKGISTSGDFDSRTGLKGAGSTDSGLKDGPNSGAAGGLKTLPEVNTDPMVVDGRNVPSGLPKSVDDAIVSGYVGAPPGVSDRVRKAFQAISVHDWKVARAWFQDALNHDPDNAGLKRLVDLADFTETRYEIKARSTSSIPIKPSTNEDIPANADPRTYALTSTKTHTREAWVRFISQRYAQTGQLQLPKDSDIELIFPDQLKSPKDQDLELYKTLYPGISATEAKKMTDYLLDSLIQRIENDAELKRIK